LFAEARSGLRSDGMEDAGERLTSSDRAYGSSAADTEAGATGCPDDEDLTHEVLPPSLAAMSLQSSHRQHEAELESINGFIAIVLML